jgi:hypothetical protein
VSSFSQVQMVILFGAACLSIIAILVGSYGFKELHFKVNSQKSSFRIVD